MEPVNEPQAAPEVKRVDGIAALATFGAIATGVFALLAAMSAGGGVGMGTCLLAAAVAFGTVANALLRK